MSTPVPSAGGQHEDQKSNGLSPTQELPMLRERLRVTTLVSGSIAHDLNNLLMIIENLAMARVEAAGAAGDAQAELILKTARSAARLSNRLLALGRPHPSEPRLFELNELVIEQLEAIRAVVGRRIDVEFAAGAHLEPVFADADQIRDVLLNLAVNAREAMQAGGRLAISTRTESVAQAQGDLLPGSYARLSFEDTGAGMNAQTAAQVFEPYFTTKDRRSNSGLGLSGVREVLRKLGGGIEMASTPGSGTRFDLYLPMIANPGEETRQGVVLLVEDSEELRELLRHFLLSQGYTVVAAGRAEALLEIEQTLQDEPWAVIADMLIAGMGGTALVQLLKERHPHLHAVVISGNARPEDAALPQEAVFLQKPFSLQSLAAVLERFPAPGARSLESI